MSSTMEFQLPAFSIRKRWNQIITSTNPQDFSNFISYLEGLKSRQIAVLRSSTVSNLERLRARAYLAQIRYFEMRAQQRLANLGIVYRYR